MNLIFEIYFVINVHITIISLHFSKPIFFRSNGFDWQRLNVRQTERNNNYIIHK